VRREATACFDMWIESSLILCPLVQFSGDK
jgi:hypothetical protein